VVTAIVMNPANRLDDIVGYSFLRNYKVAFDYPNATLSLFPA